MSEAKTSRLQSAKLQNLCEQAKNANLILPIPIEKGIMRVKGSHFWLVRIFFVTLQRQKKNSAEQMTL